MVRIGHPGFRIGPRAQLRRQHERDDARQIGLQREHLQIEHDSRVRFEAVGRAGRLLHDRQLARALFLGALNTALDVANRFDVLRQLLPVARSEVALQPRQLAGHRIQDASIRRQSRQAFAAVRASGITEQPLEDRTRIVLHRQRRGRPAPAERGRVGATEAGIACSGELRRIQTEFERGELRLLPELARGNLVDRNARLEVCALGRLDVDAGEERSPIRPCPPAGSPGSASPGLLSRPEMTSIRSRNAASGSSIGVIS